MYSMFTNINKHVHSKSLAKLMVALEEISWQPLVFVPTDCKKTSRHSIWI